MRGAALLALAGAGSTAAAPLDAVRNLCMASFGNSSFDLKGFQAQQYYLVQDASNNAGSRNFTYYFNVCKNVDPTMLPGNAATACNLTYAGGWNPGKQQWGPAPAFQYSNAPAPKYDVCHRLGSTLANTTITYGLYDNTNPSRGVSVTYTGGDLCPPKRGQQVARSLKLWLICDTDVVNVPDQEMVAETDNCGYEIFVRSAYGCPRECPMGPDPATGATALCSNHGLCDFDTAVQSSRCFCNDGYSGPDCGTRAGAAAGGLSAAGGVLIAVCIFLVVTLAFLTYLWFRIRSLRLDPAAYSALRAGPDDADKAQFSASGVASAVN